MIVAGEIVASVPWNVCHATLARPLPMTEKSNTLTELIYDWAPAGSVTDNASQVRIAPSETLVAMHLLGNHAVASVMQ